MSDTSDALDGLVSVRQFEPRAEQTLDEPIWDYVSGGAADELTLAENGRQWSQIKLAPRVLTDVSALDTSLTLLGIGLAHPIVLAPTALHTSYHPAGELESVAGAKAAEALYVQSSLGGMALAPIASRAAELDQPWLMQLYVQRDRGWTREFIAAAVEAGARGFELTVDTPLLGARDKDKRDTLGTSHGRTFPMLDSAPIVPDDTPVHRRIYNPHICPDVTWDDLEWLCAEAGVPVLPKGILRPDDAARAVAAGAGGIIVSNHGARNLDTVPSTCEALPGVVAAVDGRVPVIVDGGIRRGTDIAKALCLGAAAIQIGRPLIWGLAVAGAPGVARVVDILRTELEQAMALLGVSRLSDLTEDLLWQRN